MVNRTHYDGSVSHVTGIVNITRRGLRGDAVHGSTASGCAPTFPASPSRWTASSTRSSRRPTARSSATSRSSASRSTSTARATRPAGSGAQPDRSDHPFAQLAGVPRRRLGDRLAVLPVDLARLRVRDVPRRAHRAARPAGARDARPLRAVHVQAVAARLHAQQDDQAQQGSASSRIDDPFALLEKLHIY